MRNPGLRLLFAGLALGGLAAASPVSAALLSSPPDSPFIVESWTVQDGLPQSSVISVVQARDGYLWLGTLEGLVRFDGVRFTVFAEHNTPGLGSSRVVFLFEDSQTNLWIGTETAGVVLARNGQVQGLEKIGGGSRDGRVVSACEDARGAVWLFAADGQLYRHLAGSVDVWNLGGGPPVASRSVVAEPDRIWVGPTWLNDGTTWLSAIGPLDTLRPPQLPVMLRLPVASVDLLLGSSNGGYWRLANGRVQKCRANTLERDHGLYPWPANARPSAACEDAEGNLVVGTLTETGGEGIYWYDARGNVTRIGHAEGFARDGVLFGVLSLCLDREGDLWAGTDGGGLYRVRRRRFEVLPPTKDWVVQSVCADTNGGLWVGANNGQLGRWQDAKFERFEPGGGLDRPSVRAVFVDSQQRVWLGTWGRGLLRLAGSRFEPVAAPLAVQGVVQAIHEDGNGALWVGTQNGLARWAGGRDWRVFTKADGLTSEIVRALAADAEGGLWIGTEGGGLNRLLDGRFTAFRKGDGRLPSDRVTALLLDNAGVLWVGTAGGLARFDGRRWTHLTTADGLVSNSISYLLDGGDGDIWLGSNAGLMRLNKEALNRFVAGRTPTISCRAYQEADGLPTRECAFGSQPAAGHTTDGRLWFPTTRGLVGLKPAELKPNPLPPPVVIESVSLEGRIETSRAVRAPRPTVVTVPPRKHRLEIQYTSLNLAAPERSRFQYRMRGYETEWTDAGNRRLAPYPKLAPGAYTFEVKACNEDGLWSESPATLGITVLPPFWRTWWFVAASALAVLGGVVGTVHLVSTQKLKRQLRQQEALEKERSRIARDLHDQLGANLTQVSLLGELVEADKDLPAEVESHARQITQTSRETTRALDEIVWATNPANDTLEGLVNYVCKYAQEYLALAKLRYRLEVPSPLPATPLPPEVRHNVFLAAKEAINNIVKHARAQSAWVRLRMDTAQFTLEIQDDGCGLPADTMTSTRNGLKNMRKRLADVGGTFVIEPAPERGLIVRLAVPLHTPPL
jgi:signal transduction histidine kinase/ligand-binding sensor domain-containing protein